MDIKPFENKVWLSSPTMHGDELKYITEAYETNFCLRAIQGCSLECHQQRGPFCKGPLYFRSVPNSLTITNQLASSTASLSAPTLMQA